MRLLLMLVAVGLLATASQPLDPPLLITGYGAPNLPAHEQYVNVSIGQAGTLILHGEPALRAPVEHAAGVTCAQVEVELRCAVQPGDWVLLRVPVTQQLVARLGDQVVAWPGEVPAPRPEEPVRWLPWVMAEDAPDPTPAARWLPLVLR